MSLGAAVMKDMFTLPFDPHSCLWEGGIVTPLRNKDIETLGSWYVGDSNRAMPGPTLCSSFNSFRKPSCIAPTFLHVPLLLKLGQSELPSNIWLYFVLQCLLTFPWTTQPHAGPSARPSLVFADLPLSLSFNLSLSSGKVRLRLEVTWPRSSRRWVANVGTETTAPVTIR